VSRVFLTMAMSLDGFITGPGDSADNPAGIGGMRLMDWLDGVEQDQSEVKGYRPADASSPHTGCRNPQSSAEDSRVNHRKLAAVLPPIPQGRSGSDIALSDPDEPCVFHASFGRLLRVSRAIAPSAGVAFPTGR